jgi:hypothetical protein
LLVTACRQLHVDPPPSPPTRADIYRAEYELRRVGLDVRPVG